MREVHVSEVTALVRRLCMEANYHLPEDIQQSFVRGKEAEQSPLGKTIFDEMIRNCRLACDQEVPICQDTGTAAEQSPLGKTIFDEMIRNCRLACDQEVPICQDTGTAVIFASVGQDVHLVGGAFEDAVNEGVRQGYTDGYLRKSIVSDPLRRVNTNDNTPAVLHTRLVPGEEIEIIVAPKGGGSENMSALKMFTPAATRDQIVAYIADTVIARLVPGEEIEIIVAPKGGGSENMSALKMFTPAATRDQIVAYIADTVIAAGSNPCPPVIIGVGLGGTADKASELAKKALLRPVDVHSADEFYAEMERDILERVNKSGVGPQGLGGTVTALACAIEPYPTHIASLPCAISIGCHITRHAAGRI